MRSVGKFGALQQISTGFASWSVTARHSSRGRQPNFVALNRWRHVYSARRPSCWALVHISSYLCIAINMFLVYIRCQGQLYCYPAHCNLIALFLMAALHNRCGIIFLPCGFYLSSFFLLFSSPNLSGRRLGLYHTSTHGVALVRI